MHPGGVNERTRRVMNTSLQRQNGTTLVLQIAAAVLLATGANALIALGGFSSTRHLIQPPALVWIDRVVGYVWVALFALMATGRWLILRSGSPDAPAHARLLAWLIVICALYPIYTLGLQLLPGLIGNIFVLVLSVRVARGIWASSHAAAIFTTLVSLWVTVASIYVFRLLQLNP